MNGPETGHDLPAEPRTAAPEGERVRRDGTGDLSGFPPLVWEEPPPRAIAEWYPHAQWARQLRERPGRSARLPVANAGLVSQINQGLISAYLPRGAFRATSRYGVIWARYVGGPGNRVRGEGVALSVAP